MLTLARPWIGATVLLAALSGAPIAGARTLPDFEIREWFALGSGCRAIPGRPGDVTLRARARSGFGYELLLSYPGYGLEGSTPVVAGAATFARECGARIALYPGQGRRLRHVSATTGFVFRKEAGALLRLRARLLLGNTVVALREHWVERADRSAASSEQTVEVDLIPRSDAPFSGLRCEQPKIVGVDLSIATFRDDLAPRVAASVLNRALAIGLEFEPCTRSPR